MALASEMEEYKMIQSIPGIGEKIAATIIFEIVEIDRYNYPKKLVAFAGVNPSVHSSGKFTATLSKPHHEKAKIFKINIFAFKCI